MSGAVGVMTCLSREGMGDPLRPAGAGPVRGPPGGSGPGANPLPGGRIRAPSAVGRPKTIPRCAACRSGSSAVVSAHVLSRNTAMNMYPDLYPSPYTDLGDGSASDSSQGSGCRREADPEAGTATGHKADRPVSAATGHKAHQPGPAATTPTPDRPPAADPRRRRRTVAGE
ncbi:hypothetical protein FMEAI12_3960034 [Parafrankia sp. Ea1.12]|nr:hypothetical protein FMEAI12_3960034 [Parafrankia sp. Ea1.12]